MCTQILKFSYFFSSITLYCILFQVPPAELEALLVSHPDVLDAAVVGRPDADVGELPTAFVIKRSNNLTERQILNYIAGKYKYYFTKIFRI